jgi:Tol biopolymer transport system component
VARREKEGVMAHKLTKRPARAWNPTPAFATRALVALALAAAATSCRGASEAVSPFPNPATPIDARIAFVSTRDGSPYIYLYLSSRDSSVVRRLTRGDMPAWSADGRRIAFQWWSGGAAGSGVLQVRVINVDGSGERVVAPAGSNPAWSPDGTRIVFESYPETSDGGLFAINADGSGLTRLLSSEFDDPGAGDGLITPAFSPDGSRIAFILANFEKVRRLFIMNADGSAPRAIPNSYAIEEPRWSPDGSMIAYGILGGVGSINADGSGLRTYLSGAVDPDWSPDGRSLLFGRSHRIYAFDRASGAVRQLIPDAIAPAMANYRDDFATWSRVNP